MTEPLYLDPVAEPVPGDAPQTKRLRRWPWIFGVVVALAAGVGIGLSTTPSEAENQAKIDAALAGEREALAAQSAEVAGKAADAEKAAGDAEAAMKKAQETQVAANQHAVTVNAQLDERKQQLDSREQRLVPREADAARSTFGSGLHRVGVDINPGTYRTTGGPYCYWERLSGTSGEFDDLIANDVPSGPSVVTISSSDAAFKSQDCGTWTKTG